MPLEKTCGESTPVMVGKDYDLVEDRSTLFGIRLKNYIMHKTQKNRPLVEDEISVNKAGSRMRYMVECTFGSMRRLFEAGVAKYVGLAKTYAIMKVIAYNPYHRLLDISWPIVSNKWKIWTGTSILKPSHMI